MNNRLENSKATVLQWVATVANGYRKLDAKMAQWPGMQRTWLRKGIQLVVSGTVFLLLLIWAIAMGAFGIIPTRDDIRSVRNDLATEVYSEDGVLIGKYFLQNRTGADLEEIPQYLIDALVSTEDVRFFEHDGVDSRSLARVVIKTVVLRNESSGGGSTITQQLAKNLFGRENYGPLSLVLAKVKEFIVARRLEELYTKEQILELYLNTVSFGENVYGIETASLRYFNKKPVDLNLEEAAVLVGLLKANSKYNPRKNPENARERRNVVLGQMLKYEYLTQAEYEQLCAKPLEINYYNLEDEKPAPYFLAAIRPEIKEILSDLRKPDGSEYDLDRDGLVVETTLSSSLQRYANQAVWRQMQRIQRNFNAHWGESAWKKLPDFLKREVQNTVLYKRLKAGGASEEELEAELNKEKSMVVFAYTEEGDERKNMSTLDSVKYAQALMSCGLVALDPVRGTVKAWVGGPSFQYLPYDHVLSRRQTASAFKPVVYAAALEKGISPCTYFENELKTYPEFVNWTPENHDRMYGGEYTMRGALKRSINVATVEALMKTGRGNVVRMARKLGFKGEMDDRPAMALGANTASLLELVAAYGAFANGGKAFTPVAVTRITDQMGNVLYERKPAGMRAVMDTANVSMLTDMLRAVINEGTGNSVRSYGLSGDYAGKTGTAQNYSDGWFVGYTPKIVAGVWVGASSPLVHFRDARGAGNATALPIWANFMGSVERSGLSRRYVVPFKPLSASLQEKMRCPDYKPGLMDEINQMFLDDEGTVDDLPGSTPETSTPEAAGGLERKPF